jgi:hypothetical protein
VECAAVEAEAKVDADAEAGAKIEVKFASSQFGPAFVTNQFDFEIKLVA